jgi:hypothetical protein
MCELVRFRLESGQWTGCAVRGVDQVDLTVVVVRKTGRNVEDGGVNAV